MVHLSKIAALSLALTAAASAAPVLLYNNAGIVNGVPALNAIPTSQSGITAVSGTGWSELQRDAGGANAVAGFSGHNAGGVVSAFRFADDFTVPAGGWRINSVALYAYQSGAPLGAFPFDRITLRIWTGRPGDAGSRVIWGDATTNRFSNNTSTGIYRIFNSVALPSAAVPVTTRQVWRTEANLGTGLTLNPGRYWIDWQYASSSPIQARALVPAATHPNVRAVAGANAIQLPPGLGAAWNPLVDTGKPDTAPDIAQDLPFMLYGTLAPPPSCGDANGDHIVNGSDLSVLLFTFGNTVAPGSGADFNLDGIVDGADLSILLAHFSDNC